MFCVGLAFVEDCFAGKKTKAGTDGAGGAEGGGQARHGQTVAINREVPRDLVFFKAPTRMYTRKRT